MRTPRLGPTSRDMLAVAESATATLATEAVSDKPWSDFSDADYTVGQYHRAAALHRHTGPAKTKEDCSLPYKEPNGTVNRNGVHAAAGRIGSAMGTSEQKKAAAKTLVRVYGTIQEDPPQSLSDMAKESAVPLSSGRTAVREAATMVGAAGAPGRYLVQLIKAGWSLNGVYYSADVLRRDGAAAWPKGTLNYVDHDTDAEEESRPSGSLSRLASYQTTDARWDDQRQALVAEVRAFAPWQEAVASWAESGAIGMSIRAWVYAQDGEAEGRTGLLVSSVVEGRSCDYVTVPAAGGAILAVLESVRQHGTKEAANIGAWLESRLHLALTTYADDMYGSGVLTREERIVLSGAIGDGLQAWTTRVEADAPQLFTRGRWDYPEAAATPTEEARRVAEATAEEIRADLADEIAEQYGDEDTYTWVRDYDPGRLLVWFNISSGGESATWQQSYTVADDGDCELTGDKVEVTPRTVYDPVEPEDEPQPADPDEEPAGAAAAAEPAAPPAAVAVREDVTDGDMPPANSPSSEEGSAVAEVQTGAPPATVVTAPAATAPPTDTAATTAVLEAMQALTRQVTALTESNTALTERANQRDAEDRTARNRQAAREAVAAALAAPEVPQDLREQIGPRVTSAVLANVPVTDTGDLDTTALGEAITAAVEAESGYAARLLESAGVGRPRGLGSRPATEAQTVEAFEAQMAGTFEKLGLSPAAALIAAKGRG
jgi:hypothetical protein